MKYLVLIQARCGSSRLPQKVLLPLSGKLVIERVIERVKMSKLVDEVMVVTSIEKSNLPILNICAKNDIRVFIGSENDVLDRYYQAAKLLKPEYIIRVTGDCPLFDGGLLDQAIMELKPDTDYMGMMSETFADGLDLEIVKYSALKRAWEEANIQSQREHVTQYIIRNPEKFVLQDFRYEGESFGDKRWTLDEPEDYEFIKNIYERLVCDNEEFSYTDILKLVQNEPHLENVNKMYTRNEGLAKSLLEDRIVDVD